MNSHKAATFEGLSDRVVCRGRSVGSGDKLDDDLITGLSGVLEMGAWVKVGSVGDVAPGRVKCVRVGDRKVVIFNENGTLFAYDDYCTHVGGPLSQGSCENGVVTCLWHGAQFRVADGAPLTPPAGGKLRSHPLRIRAELVEIDLDE